MSRYVNPVPQYYLNDGSVASSGKLYFYENKDPNTKKDTFSNEGETIANTNPVLLDGEGRCPPIFGSGRYTVVLKSNKNIQQWSRDDVDLTDLLGQFADWSAIISYNIGDIVQASDGRYYSSLTNNNLGNDPTTTPTVWEQIEYITVWNENATYSEDDLVIFGGAFYRSVINSNLNNQPDSSSTFIWADTASPRDWLSTRTYNTENIVVHNSSIWSSTINGNINEEPGVLGTNWQNISSSASRIFLTGPASGIDSNFNGTFIWDDVGGHILSINSATIDEGATTTTIICDPLSPSNITITNSLDVILDWSFDSPPGTVDGYEIKPGETLRLVSYALDSYKVYPDNGISEIVELGGEFNSGQNARLTRIGNMVTIATIGSVTHPVDNIVNSAAAVVPSLYRPENTVTNLYQINNSPDRIDNIIVFSSGAIQTSYLDFSGTGVNATDTGGVASITYDIINS